MAAVTHPDWSGVGGQGQLITGARVAEDVATVPAVVLEDGKEAVRECCAAWVCTPALADQPLKVQYFKNPSSRGLYHFERGSSRPRVSTFLFL